MTVRQADLISNRQRSVRLQIGTLGRFAEQASRELKFPEGSVAVQLVTDAAMSRLNWTYRKKRGSTDVLSFPAQPQNGRRPARKKARNGEPVFIGDIAISPTMARLNAKRDARSLADEMRILVLHGMIHLAGYDHETDQGQMERLEKKLRRRLGIPA